MATSHHLHHAGFPSYHTTMMSAAGGANSNSGSAAAAAAGGPNYRSSGPYQQQQQQQSADFFTAEMRDRQARGKDPYRDSDSDSDDRANLEYAARRRTTTAVADTFAYAERRRQATQILDTPELLMANAQRDGISIPATRLRYTRMLCGVGEDAAGASSSSRQSGGSSKNAGGRSAGNTPKKRDRPSSRTH